MGEPIKDIAFDKVVSLLDYAVGTDFVTKKTFSYQFQDIVNLAQAVSGGVVNTSNVNTVTETALKDYLQVLNTNAALWVINPADIPFAYVLDTGSAFKALYIYKRTSTSTIKIGAGELQVVAGDFISIRIKADFGETNTLSSLGGTSSLVGTKVGDDLKVRGLTADTDISIILDGTGNFYRVSVTGGKGENNTSTSLTAGGESINSAKVGLDLPMKGIKVVGANIASDATDVTITATEKVLEPASFTLVAATHNRNTIHVKNGAAVVVVTCPNNMPADFECGFIIYGTGQVSWAAGAGATILQTELIAKGAGATVWVENDPSTPATFNVVGDTKA